MNLCHVLENWAGEGYGIYPRIKVERTQREGKKIKMVQIKKNT